MLSKVKPSGHIGTSIKYNEQKVANGKAERIGADNFLRDADQLTRKDIRARFLQRSTFNERIADNGAHITLNFGSGEKLENKKLFEIARRYMEGMGFADEPYVVYRHLDAGHPHLHVVVTTVRADGSWIPIYLADIYRSHELCRQLEKEFSLEKNRAHSQSEAASFAVDAAQKVVYGNNGLIRSISDVVNTVYSHYNYSDLDEYNAVLREYNVQANPGREGSRMRRHGGLQYHAVDDDGNKVGKPLKASLFHVKPTLKNLERRIEDNRTVRETDRQNMTFAVEWALAGTTPTWKALLKNLEREGISVVSCKRQDGSEGLFFVDHAKKTVFSDLSLGLGYRGEFLRNRCVAEEQMAQEQQLDQHLKLSL